PAAPVVPEVLPEPFPDNDLPEAPERPQAGTSTPVEMASTTAASPGPVATGKVVELPEAPASCNVYVLIDGHKVQITLRDRDEQRMLARLKGVLAQSPAPQPFQGAGKDQAASPEPEKRYCPLHGTEMQLNHKEGRSWWSHKTPDGWCKGK